VTWLFYVLRINKRLAFLRAFVLYGAGTRSRTRDLLITSPNTGLAVTRKTLELPIFLVLMGNRSLIIHSGVDVLWTFLRTGFSLPRSKSHSVRQGFFCDDTPRPLSRGKFAKAVVLHKKSLKPIGGSESGFQLFCGRRDFSESSDLISAVRPM
jgi:hypothetical protein